MIDRIARGTAITILQDLRSGQLLPSAWERSWPKRTRDLAVRSVGYWVWTLFDDHIDAPIQVVENSEEQRILGNSIQFLASDREFYPRDSGLVSKVKTVIVGGVEWIGCELPWHIEWPFPPSEMVER